MNLSNIPTSELIDNYKKLSLLLDNLFDMVECFHSNTHSVEPREILDSIVQELGIRQINGVDVKAGQIK